MAPFQAVRSLLKSQGIRGEARRRIAQRVRRDTNRLEAQAQQRSAARRCLAQALNSRRLRAGELADDEQANDHNSSAAWTIPGVLAQAFGRLIHIQVCARDKPQSGRVGLCQLII